MPDHAKKERNTHPQRRGEGAVEERAINTYLGSDHMFFSYPELPSRALMVGLGIFVSLFMVLVWVSINRE